MGVRPDYSDTSLTDKKKKKKKTLTEEIQCITAGIRSRELCQAPISASVILSLTVVVGESLSFSTLQMQRRLCISYRYPFMKKCRQKTACRLLNSGNRLTRNIRKVSWILKIPKFSKFDSP